MYFEEEILPLNAGVHDQSVAEIQLFQNVFRDLRRGRCGKRQHRWTPEFPNGIAQSQIGGTKIMSPLRDAMRLIDYKQRDAAPLENCDVLGFFQPFRSDI